MRGDVEELYDYETLRRLPSATAMIVHTSAPTVVLGSSQTLDVLREERRRGVAVRRRRGGGGAVLVQPGDLWVDWWLPAHDARWSPDVHATSALAGEWWRAVLAQRVDREVLVHEGSLRGDPAWRVACFAGRGPGEVFVDDRKVVGITQWRVREGAFLSSVVHANSSGPLLDVLVDVPLGLASALAHHTLATLDLDADDVASALIARAHPVAVRQLFLIA